jgi:DNA-binding NarL/FixJ family response regulator
MLVERGVVVNEPLDLTKGQGMDAIASGPGLKPLRFAHPVASTVASLVAERLRRASGGPRARRPKGGIVCRIVIAGEIGVYAEGLGLGLAAHDLDVAGSATDAVETMRLLRECKPDVLLLDMAMPAGLSLLPVIAAEHAHVRVLALAIEETEDLVIACAEAGVAGYVPRDARVAEVATIARDAAAGHAACSPRIVARLLHRVATLSAARPEEPTDGGLTRREAEILGLIDDGMSNKQIARELCIEVATVKNHVHNILGKLQVSRRSEAAAVVRSSRAAAPYDRRPLRV